MSLTLEQRRDRAVRIMCNLISFYLFLGLMAGATALIMLFLTLGGAVEWGTNPDPLPSVTPYPGESWE